MPPRTPTTSKTPQAAQPRRDLRDWPFWLSGPVASIVDVGAFTDGFAEPREQSDVNRER
jgi:hypothetical protein